MSTRIRHWKQHWDPTADFVFLKRLRMGDNPDNPFVLPGEPVTAEMRAKMGEARVKRWWEAQVIGRADWDLSTPGSPREKVAEEMKPQGSITPGKRGWFLVTFPDGTQKNFRGEAKAKAALDEASEAALA